MLTDIYDSEAFFHLLNPAPIKVVREFDGFSHKSDREPNAFAISPRACTASIDAAAC